MTTNKHEKLAAMLWQDCSLLTVITIQVAEFCDRNGTAPQLILLNKRLRGAFVREITRGITTPLADLLQTALIDPVYIDGIAALFSLPADGELYLKLQHKGIKKEQTL